MTSLLVFVVVAKVSVVAEQAAASRVSVATKAVVEYPKRVAKDSKAAEFAVVLLVGGDYALFAKACP